MSARVISLDAARAGRPQPEPVEDPILVLENLVKAQELLLTIRDDADGTLFLDSQTTIARLARVHASIEALFDSIQRVNVQDRATP